MFSHPLHPIGVLLLSASVLISCKNNERNAPALSFGTERYDSAALHLSVVTDKDCLPIIYAKRSGLFDSLGVRVQLQISSSQADCDTALLGKYADGGMADLVRLDAYAHRNGGFKTMWEGTDCRSIFSCGTLRVKEVRTLKGHTVAVSPRSADSRFLLDALKSVSLKETDVYWPQLGNMRLRADMLKGDQIDATVLLWPFTSQATANGHRCIYRQKEPDGKTAFVMKADRMKERDTAFRWKLFEKARRLAIDSLRSPHCRDAVSLILQKDYGLAREVADTIRLPY